MPKIILNDTSLRQQILEMTNHLIASGATNITIPMLRRECGIRGANSRIISVYNNLVVEGLVPARYRYSSHKLNVSKVSPRTRTAQTRLDQRPGKITHSQAFWDAWQRIYRYRYYAYIA